jgi:membrane-associated phospholipid phosphatase
VGEHTRRVRLAADHRHSHRHRRRGPTGTRPATFFLAASFTPSLTIARRRRTHLLLVAAGLSGAALVGVSRLVLVVHWLSDVVAEWALGTAIAVGVVAIVWWLAPRDGSPERS